MGEPLNQRDRKYAARGFLVGLLVLSIAVTFLIVVIAFQYDGECGGWPFLSSPRPCSFMDHVVMHAILIVPMALLFNSPWILLFLIFCTTVGYGIGRWKTNKEREVS